MIVIQKLLIMLDLWVAIINISNAKHVKKRCSMESNMVVGLVRVRRGKKKVESFFDRNKM